VTTRSALTTGLRALAVVVLALALAACGRNMEFQPRVDPLTATPFFPDGTAQRPLIEGTVPRGRGAIDPAFFTGQGPAGMLTELPFELTVAVLQRGQERYDIYCAVCHGYTGEGDGMIVQRGFPRPTSFHAQRLLDAPVGYFFAAATNGFGRMYPYASRIPAEDRWAISAYVKALQLSQNATVGDLPDAVRRELGLEPLEGRVAP
jgi:mono/diheme cytochrome c family protein